MASDEISRVNKLYIDAVSHGLSHSFGNPNSDPFLAKDYQEFGKRKRKLVQQIKDAAKTIKTIINVSQYIENKFQQSSEHDQREILSFLEFDCKNQGIHWFKCKICQSCVMLTKKQDKRTIQCKTCSKSRCNEKLLLDDNRLPIWKCRDGKIHYNIPSELQGLSLGEKLLIQQYSTLLPLIHLYKGRLGLRGNSVSFSKDMNSICTELPRKQAEIIIVVREQYDSKTDTLKNQNFKVNKKKVLNALYWLKQHHTGYKHITIKKENLNWIGDNEESYLNKDNISHLHLDDILDEDIETDVETVAATQTEVSKDSGTIHYSGVTAETATEWTHKNDKKIVHDIESFANEEMSMNVDKMNFPHVSEEPLNEFHTENMLANSYPWLFPGGLGDKSHSLCGKQKTKDARAWVENLMRWHDGRFMRDEMFSFHLHNFLQRHVNNSSGLVFVKQFIEDASISIKTIHDQIRKGDTSFISKLQYFAGQKIRGSDPFWRSVKHEVDQWITYHLKKGHGPPTLFLTFSCAEYWWQDLEDLLCDRCKGTEDEQIAQNMKNAKDVKTRTKAKSILIERYSAVVQEFFQIKMDNWLETVGKKEFGIKHYWLRFEFAKGRGTIHAHLLAITKDYHIVKQFHDANKRSKQQGTKVISNYARNILKLTAEKPCSLANDTQGRAKVNPLSLPYCSIVSSEEDKEDLVDNVHMHICGPFCLRYSRKR